MSDIRRWTLLSLLGPEFIDNLQSSAVFGSSGSEALLITKDDHIYGAPKHGSLDPSKVEYLSGRRIRQIAFGSGPHVLGLSEDGQVYSWGHNAFGQLGLGHTLQGTSPMLVQGSLLGERVVQVACGGHHSAAITDRGEVFTWGLNSSGQLGIGSVVNQDSPRLVFLHNRFLRSVACGHNSTMVLTESGDVYGWGYNGNGQIGTGNLSNQHSPFFLESLAKTAVITQIVCGYAHSLALSDEGNLYVWGSNSCGQLGGNLLRKNLTEPVYAAKDVGRSLENRMSFRITEVAAVHLCNITVVSNKAGKVFMWGHVRGQTIATPVETRFSCIDDAFACFASPPVNWRMLQFVIIKKRREEIISVNNSSCIEVNEFSYPTYRSFLNWLYTDELNVDPDDAVVLLGLLELANCYCEMGLKVKCAAIIQKGITIDNAALLYATAVKYDVPTLEEYCFHFCLNHMTAVTQSEGFRRLDDIIIKQLICRAAKEGIFKR
uniref:BTB domain-containing protein n=1 Tax=Heterorhabditis bacteriophora TaxID=37862 RepID=A0A1I7XCX1_HETBA